MNAGTAPSVPPDAALGQAIWLMMHTPMYRFSFISDIEWMLLPPILLNQYQLFQIDGRVVAFSAWGYLSDAVEKRLESPISRLAPADWKSGERLCLVHLIAPFGHHERALKEMRETSLVGKNIKIRRLGSDGQSVSEVLPAIIKTADGA